MTEFRTADLPLAAFLHSTRKLKFLRCESVSGNGGGKLEFIFEDPDGQGEDLHLGFESGAECPAASFYDSLRHIRKIMTRTPTNQKGEQSNHERSY